MRKLFIVMLLLLLASCSPIYEEYNEPYVALIEDINIYEAKDVRIDNDAKQVSFRVPFSYNVLDSNSFIGYDYIRNIDVYSFTDEFQYLGNKINLYCGENTYYVKIYCADQYEYYEVNIYREEPRIMEIRMGGLKTLYQLNEDFVPGNVNVIYEGYIWDNVKITKDMVVGFDTSSLGLHRIEINYEGFIAEFYIKVV